MQTVKRKMEGSSIADPFSGVRVATDEILTKEMGQRSPNASNKKIVFHNTVELIVLALIWYLCAIITITSTKELMNRVQLPFLLCTSQFIFASALTFMYLKFSNMYKPIPPEAQKVVYQISATYTLGFVLTNVAFSLGNEY